MQCLVKTRNCLVSNYCVNINYFYTENKIIDFAKSYYRYLMSCVTCLFCIPFTCVKNIFSKKYTIIYNMDKLY